MKLNFVDSVFARLVITLQSSVDTETINKAMEKVSKFKWLNKEVGGKVLFAPGIYSITDTIYLS